MIELERSRLQACYRHQVVVSSPGAAGVGFKFEQQPLREGKITALPFGLDTHTVYTHLLRNSSSTEPLVHTQCIRSMH